MSLFKFGQSEYNFKDMIVIDGNHDFWRLQFKNDVLWRIGQNKIHMLGPSVLSAYEDYVIDNILLGDEPEHE